MTASIIDGKQISADMRSEMKDEISELAKRGIVPGLGVVLVGEDPASKSYVKSKKMACEQIGIYSDNRHLSSDTTQQDVISTIKKLNDDRRINGILVQMPLPKHLNQAEILLAIVPDKDVDGFHPINIGKIRIGKEAFLSCTPHGIIQLLVRSGITIDGANITIVGRNDITGRPLANMLIQKSSMGNATVTICDTHTKNLKKQTLNADILIAAAGRARIITADMVKDGAAVIDAGANRVEDATTKKGYSLVGDVDFDAVKEKAAFITPVPGGVGPMTITMLLYNTIESAKRAEKRRIRP
jgi:methylenetetrahydrofolate dehydrogenase (NADP+)/methenyltetrahydrofolate cyclohydrolase